jgi:hypothetical protein
MEGRKKGNEEGRTENEGRKKTLEHCVGRKEGKKAATSDQLTSPHCSASTLMKGRKEGRKER